jgi:aldose 1-epimerase
MQYAIQIRHENNFAIISLLNAAEGVCAEIYSFGGLLNRFELPVQGNPFNIVDGYASIADAQARCAEGFQSVRLSPFVCRLKKGSYEWNGMAYQIEKKYLGKWTFVHLGDLYCCTIRPLTRVLVFTNGSSDPTLW